PDAPAYWTIWVRVRSSTNTSSRLSPTFTSFARSAIGSALLGDGTLGHDADGAGGDDELAVLIVVLGHRGAEEKFPGPALLLPSLARLAAGMQQVPGAQRSVVREVLLGVEASATS